LCPGRARLGYDGAVLSLVFAILTDFERHATAEVVWNRARTWGAYTLDDELSIGKFRTLFVIQQARGERFAVTQGRYDAMKGTREIDEFVIPSLLSWAPDDRHLVFVMGHYMSVSIESNGIPLYDYNIDTGQMRLLTQPFQTARGHEDCRSLYWNDRNFSSDGKNLLLVMGSGKYPMENKRIALLDYKTLQRTWLTGWDVAARNPSRSPDGKRIVYEASPTDLPADSKAEAEGSFAELYALYDLTRLWVVNADGTGRRQLTNGAGLDTAPKWRAPDRIEFLHNETEVWSMRPDGSRQRFVRKLTEEETQAWLVNPAG
jgi:hypothetical protein